jgi:hypothetical protein
MNERIKELIWETDEWLESNAQSDRWEREIKFAELIVRECATISAMFSINKNSIHPDIEWDEMTESVKIASHSTCQQVSRTIKQHFGVEL